MQERARQEMVLTQIARRGISDWRVLTAMLQVPRHLFVPERWRDLAHLDAPAPIGADQTISQPYIVAFMTDLLEVADGDRVLEIGTGSGYQTAVLAAMGAEVFSVELVESLSTTAATTLADLGYAVHLRHGDGYDGWPEHAPFDRIIVTAAPPALPAALVDQLAPGGRMVIPVGQMFQDLDLVTKDADGTVHVEQGLAVRFVPMLHGQE